MIDHDGQPIGSETGLKIKPSFHKSPYQKMVTVETACAAKFIWRNVASATQGAYNHLNFPFTETKDVVLI